MAQTLRANAPAVNGTRKVRRRDLLRASFLGGAAIVLGHASQPANAQDQRLAEATRAMSAMTGEPLPEGRIAPTSALVGIILSYSTGLRALELGEAEPATQFIVH